MPPDSAPAQHGYDRRPESERMSATAGAPGATGRQGDADVWGAFGLVVSGVLVWGGVGGLVGAWLGSGIPVMIGLLVGMTAGLYLVWFRYGRA